MFDLSFAVLCTVGVAVVLRFARVRANIEAMIAISYTFSAAIGWCLLVASQASMTPSHTAIVVGVVGGWLWPGAFHLYSWCISTFGIGRTGAWARLSIAVPVVFGVVVYNEAVDRQLVAGLSALVVAFVALTPHAAPTTGLASSDLRRSTVVYAFVLIVVFGLLDTTISIFNHAGSGDDQEAFFVVLFSCAAVLSWTMLLVRRVRVATRDFLIGAVLGALNLGVSWFVLRALAGGFSGRTATAFALVSSASLLLIVGIGRTVWKEELHARDTVGICAALGAVVALSL